LLFEGYTADGGDEEGCVLQLKKGGGRILKVAVTEARSQVERLVGER
jgi:hypothetical protein